MKTNSGYINVDTPYASLIFSKELEKILSKALCKDYSEIVILCIGTDRSTGDSLGPLVGHKLQNIENKWIRIYGTLEKPVHAKNLDCVLNSIRRKYNNPFIIAIDACLGKTESIGCIYAGQGPMSPGAGVNKKLSKTGDIHIIGIVNVGGFLEYIILQNTRLNLVMKMADTISAGIYYSLFKFHREYSKIKKKASKK